MRILEQFETLILSMQQDVIFMRTLTLILLIVFVLTIGVCALMRAFSTHKEEPDLRYVDLIWNVMAVAYLFEALAAPVIFVLTGSGSLCMRFCMIYLPSVAIIGVLVVYWAFYLQKEP